MTENHIPAPSFLSLTNCLGWDLAQNYKGIFGLCVPGHDTDDCMNPRSSDLTAYEAAVEKMAAAAAANPDKARIEASMEDSGNEDGGEE